MDHQVNEEKCLQGSPSIQYLKYNIIELSSYLCLRSWTSENCTWLFYMALTRGLPKEFYVLIYTFFTSSNMHVISLYELSRWDDQRGTNSKQ